MVNIKERICRAFCTEVDAKAIANGYAIATPYENRMGDRIGIYAIGDTSSGYRIIDTALTIAYLESEGVSFDGASRKQILFNLLHEYGAQYDADLGEISISNVSEEDLPKKIIQFSTLLLRLNDMIWTAVERTKNTFREDVKAELRSELAGRATIKEDEPVSDKLSDVTPDMVFWAPGRSPVALFIATEESKLWQAMHLQLVADHEANEEVVVIALLEKQDALSGKVITKADNRLDAIPRYADEPKAALHRIVREIVGKSPTMQ